MASPNTKKTDDIEENELYNTPNKAMQGFEKFVFEDVEDVVFYDPCDGIGGISDWLEARGAKVYRSDIKTYRCLPAGSNSWLGERDFLSITKEDIPEDVEYLIFNPPFTLTEAFIDKAHELGLPFFMFNRLTALESQSRAKKFIDKWYLEMVYIFGYRVECTKGVEQTKTANAVCYAWFYFSSGFGCSVNPEVSWIV